MKLHVRHMNWDAGHMKWSFPDSLNNVPGSTIYETTRQKEL